MVLNLAVSFIYEVVKQSWLVSTVVVKYMLLAHLVELAASEFSLERLEEELLDNSRLAVTGIVLLGVVSVVTGFQVSPFLEVFSQLVALGYFAFLFWKF